jgi:hypothetical protein
MTEATYTSTLNAGLGMIEETQILLDLWRPGMSSTELEHTARSSGLFPNMTARRLRNFVLEGFAHCYLDNDGAPAVLLQRIRDVLTKRELEQLFFIYTCRAHTILADFIRDVYWLAYAAGQETLSNKDARTFVMRANQDGKTTTLWSDSTIQRVARYLTAYCADFGLLERGTKQARKILTYRIEPRVAAILAYDLHFAGHGDNAILAHPDWGLFGLERADVLEEMKQLALRNLLIVQSAGGITKISWQCDSMEELINVLTRNEL